MSSLRGHGPGSWLKLIEVRRSEAREARRQIPWIQIQNELGPGSMSLITMTWRTEQGEETMKVNMVKMSGDEEDVNSFVLTINITRPRPRQTSIATP